MAFKQRSFGRRRPPAENFFKTDFNVIGASEKTRDALARRRERERQINRLFDECKRVGDTAEWTWAARRDFINARFDTDGGMDSLSFDSFDDLEAELQERKRILIAEKLAENEQ